MAKEDCVYEVREENGKHMATLTVAELTTEKTDFKGKPAPDKKTAEANAAQKALNVLSKEIKEAKAAHDVVNKEKEQAWEEKKAAKIAEKKADGTFTEQKEASGAKGAKATHDVIKKEKGAQQHHLKQANKGGDINPKGDPKGLLNTALQMLLGRPIAKEDCVYEMTGEKGKHVATLTVAALTTEKTDFKGKPAPDKKTAEANAAQKALNVLSKEIKEAKAAHDVVKKEKEQAWEEKKAAKIAEKKADGTFTE